MAISFTSSYAQRGNTLNLFCNLNEIGSLVTAKCTLGKWSIRESIHRTLGETFTQDTSGGAYFERVAAVTFNSTSGRQMLQTVGGYFRPPSAYPIVAGLAVSVLQGAGAGQWRTIVRATNLSNASNGAFLLSRRPI